MKFVLLLLPSLLCSVEIAGRTVAIDRPGDWYDPRASHHAEHAVMGVPTGLAVLPIDDAATRYAASFLGGFSVGLAYEVYQSKDGAWIDMVDVGWVVAGSLLTTALGDATGCAVSAWTDGDSVAVAFAWGVP